MREKNLRCREMFVPLSHPPSHDQVDFGEALPVIGGIEIKVRCFCMDLPQSDDLFVKAYPAETMESLLSFSRAEKLSRKTGHDSYSWSSLSSDDTRKI